MAFFDVFGLTERYFRRRLLNKLLVSKKPHRRPLSPMESFSPLPSAWEWTFTTVGWLEIRVWDLLAAERARALGIGVLSGGYAQDDLERAGVYRVYQNPFDLLQHFDEVGSA